MPHAFHTYKEVFTAKYASDLVESDLSLEKRKQKRFHSPHFAVVMVVTTPRKMALAGNAIAQTWQAPARLA